MRICQSCRKEIPADLLAGRQAQCPFCSTDLHCCLNCVFFERGAYNDCREGQAERVLDKGRSNFCDYFRFKVIAERTNSPTADPKDKLAALFKK